MPVLVGEVCYEGIMEANREEIQRPLFWGCMLSGAAGHTYGANGIWQVNIKEKPSGPSPHGISWGALPGKRLTIARVKTSEHQQKTPGALCLGRNATAPGMGGNTLNQQG